MFSGGIKGNIDPKWVKQRQYWRERHSLMLIVTQNQEIKKLLKGLFFVQGLFCIKRFSNEIVVKFLKNVEIKIVNDPKIG